MGNKALGGGLVLELGGSAVSSSLLEVFILKAGAWLGRHSQVVVTHSQVVVTRFSFLQYPSQKLMGHVWF